MPFVKTADAHLNTHTNAHMVVLLCVKYSLFHSLLPQARLTQFHSQLNSHNLTDQSSEDNVRLLNSLLEEAMCEEEEKAKGGAKKGGAREDEKPKRGAREEYISWIKNTRQIMMDIS